MLLLLAAAHAADAPSAFLKQSVAVAGFPTGLLSETRAQVRRPLHRSDSIVFQDTYAGVGLRLDASPAFAHPGVQIAFAPIDVFDIDVYAELLGYLPGPFGLLPYARLDTKLGDVRDARTDHVPALGWSLNAAPTLKAKVGPVIVFDALTVSWLNLGVPSGVTSPYVYEPLRDLVVAWEDVAIEHQPGVLVELLPGGARPLLNVGATLRDRYAVVSEDRSLATGLLVAFRPTSDPAMPTFVGLALAYVIDQDRVGRAPFVALQASWTAEPLLGAK